MAIIDRRGASVSSADPPAATTPNPDLAIKTAVRVATTGSDIALAGLQTVDGIALAAGDRVLAKDQTDTTANGIYTASSGNWTRTADAQSNSQWAQGTQVMVAQGATLAGTDWRLTTADPIVLGTSAMAFAKVSSSPSSTAWSDITGAPTTLAGYGITDAKTKLFAAATFYVNGNAATTSSTTAAGNNTLHFAAGSGTTNATTAAGNNVLHFAATPVTIYIGAVISDTTASVIPAGTTVTGITQTTVTLSNNVTGGGVGSGDTIQWSLFVAAIGATITDATASVIPAGTTISSVTPTTIVMSATATGAGVGNGDTIQWTATCGVSGGLNAGIGSDQVTALQAQSPATPFLTLNQAYKTVINAYDFNGHKPTFNLAHGACTNYGGLEAGDGQSGGAPTGFSSFNITGDSTAPSAVTIIASGTQQHKAAMFVQHGCVIASISNFYIGDDGTAAVGLWAAEWGGIDINGGVTVGMFNTSAVQIKIEGFGHVELGAAPGLIVGGGAGSLFDISSGGRIDAGTFTIPPAVETISIPAAVAYSIATINGVGPFSLNNFGSGTFIGAGVAGTTGVRAKLTGPGYLNGGGASCDAIFPGNAASQLSNGFQDDANDTATYNGGVDIGSAARLSWGGDTFITRNVAATFRLGNFAAAAPVAQTLGVQNVVAGTSNTAGPDFTIQGAKGTGTGVGGSILLQVAPAGGSGTAQNALLTRLALLGTGFLGFGTETNPKTAFTFSQNAATGIARSDANDILAIHGSDGGVPQVAFHGYGGTGTWHFRAAGGTAASPTAVTSGTQLGVFRFKGWNGSAYSGAPAGVVGVALENFDGTHAGTGIEFDTIAAGGTTRAQAARICAGVIVGPGTTDPGAGNLQASGKLTPGSFTVGTLPAGVNAGDTVYASNCRVFNGTGTQEGAGSGTGGLVNYNGSAWKIAGTNVTAVA